MSSLLSLILSSYYYIVVVVPIVIIKLIVLCQQLAQSEGQVRCHVVDNEVICQKNFRRATQLYHDHAHKKEYG